MIFQLFLLGILAAFGDAAISFTDCTPNTDNAPPKNMVQVTKLSVEGCTAEPCTFIKGSKYKIEIVAKFNYTATAIMYTGYAIIGGEVVELMKGNWCDKVQSGSCKNIKPGAEITGNDNLEVRQTIPLYDGPVRIILRDDNQVSQYCGELKIKIENDPKLKKPSR